MIPLLLLLALGQPSVTSGTSAASAQLSGEEEYWLDLGFSPLAMQVLRQHGRAADPLKSEDTFVLARMRASVAKGLVPQEQYQAAEDAYESKRDLDQARQDHEVLRRLRGRDRHLYLVSMRPVSPAPPTHFWQAPKLSQAERAAEAKRNAEARELTMQRVTREEAEWRRLQGAKQLAYLIRLRSPAP